MHVAHSAVPPVAQIIYNRRWISESLDQLRALDQLKSPLVLHRDCLLCPNGSYTDPLQTDPLQPDPAYDRLATMFPCLSHCSYTDPLQPDLLQPDPAHDRLATMFPCLSHCSCLFVSRSMAVTFRTPAGSTWNTISMRALPAGPGGRPTSLMLPSTLHWLACT